MTLNVHRTLSGELWKVDYVRLIAQPAYYQRRSSARDATKQFRYCYVAAFMYCYRIERTYLPLTLVSWVMYATEIKNLSLAWKLTTRFLSTAVYCSTTCRERASIRSMATRASTGNAPSTAGRSFTALTSRALASTSRVSTTAYRCAAVAPTAGWRHFTVSCATNCWWTTCGCRGGNTRTVDTSRRLYPTSTNPRLVPPPPVVASPSHEE